MKPEQPYRDGRTQQWERAMSRRAKQGRKLAGGPLVPSNVKTTPTQPRRHGD